MDLGSRPTGNEAYWYSSVPDYGYSMQRIYAWVGQEFYAIAHRTAHPATLQISRDV